MNELQDIPKWTVAAKARMKELNIDQRKLAKALETQESRVSEYLRGQREPTLAMARRIKRVLGIDGNILLQE